METLKRRTRKAPNSKPLSDEQVKSLIEFRNKYDTDVACSAAIGIDRGTLLRVLYIKSATPETIDKIILAIGT